MCAPEMCAKKAAKASTFPRAESGSRNLECQTVAANQGTLAAHSRKEEKSHINKFKKIFRKWASSVQKPRRLTKRKGWIANLSFFKRRIDSLAEKGRGRITHLFGMGEEMWDKEEESGFIVTCGARRGDGFIKSDHTQVTKQKSKWSTKISDFVLLNWNIQKNGRLNCLNFYCFKRSIKLWLCNTTCQTLAADHFKTGCIANNVSMQGKRIGRV